MHVHVGFGAAMIVPPPPPVATHGMHGINESERRKRGRGKRERVAEC